MERAPKAEEARREVRKALELRRIAEAIVTVGCVSVVRVNREVLVRGRWEGGRESCFKGGSREKREMVGF